MRRAAAVGLGLAIALGVLVGTGATTRLWRAAYPHLPPRMQAVPYRLRALVRSAATPVALPPPDTLGATVAPPPTPAADGRSTGVPTGVPMGAPTARATVRPFATVNVSPATAPAARSATASNAVPTPSSMPRPLSAELGPLTHAYQTWNNCGPATISMALSVIGLDEGQARAAVRLKPNPDDKNVGPDELARYAQERGAVTALRAGGRIEVLEALVAAGVPTIVETWFEPDPGDEMGHYRLVVGYDAAARTLRMADSYEGPNVVESYADFDRDWRAFNRTYLAILPASRAEEVALVGPGGAAMWFDAAATAADEVERAPDAFGWFNLGSSLQATGDPAGAADAFDRARAIGLPWRMLWYQFGPFEAYGAAGRWSDVEALAKANLANAPDLEESVYWLGRAREAAGDIDGARSLWRRAVELNPLYEAPARALRAPDAGAPPSP